MRRRPFLLAVALALLACARNPVTGKRELSFVSEKDEIALGKQGAEDVGRSMPRYPDPKVQAYVQEVGMRMAKASERPDLPWSFTVVDDPAVNAFALPGGPIFVTRGILTHLNSEAELAAVVGHEIGHVTARHSVHQMSQAQLAQLGLGIGAVGAAVLGAPEVAQLGAQLGGAGLQILFLKYGRDAERQSDELGFRYMVGQGYDPRQMAGVFGTLARVSAQAGGGRVPEWQSTHPDPENREETARARAEKVANAAQLKVERERYLAVVNGMPFGDDPRQGFFRGDAFLHPELKFRMDFPAGWPHQNTASAVAAMSPKKDAAIQLALAGKTTPEQAAKQFFGQKGIRAAADPVGRLGALPQSASYFEAETQQGALHGLVSFVAHGENTYMLVGFTPAGQLKAHDAAFKQALGSFGPLTDPAALAIQPARLELVKVPRDMTVAEFHAQFPSSQPVEVVALVNGVAGPDARLRAGDTAKRIVGGPPPEPKPKPGAK
jgi:predicted Zn-dependent protease